jgi:hypothetical protein
MRGSAAILGVLLGASLLANAMLAVRLSKAPDPVAPVKPGATVKRIDSNDDPKTLRESLEVERKKVAELQAKVERLETDKKVLAQDAPAAAKVDKLEAFRAKLRKLVKLSKDPAAKAGTLDPDSMVEATEVVMEFLKMAATRTKDPKNYADHLKAFYEVGLEGEAPLSEAQAATLSRLLEDMGNDLAKIPATPAGERLVREIEVEGAAMSRISGLLTEQQRTLLQKGQMNALGSGNMLSTSYVPQGTAAVDQIVQQWTAAYQLDTAQQAQAKVAAQSYADAMKRSGGTFSFEKQGAAEHFDYRLRSAREQLAALQMLQASMTPAQQERLRTQAVREIMMYDPNAVPGAGAATGVDEK